MYPTYLCINKSRTFHVVREYKTKHTEPCIEVFSEKQCDAIRNEIHNIQYAFEEEQHKRYHARDQALEKAIQELEEKRSDMYAKRERESNTHLQELVMDFQEKNPQYYI